MPPVSCRSLPTMDIIRMYCVSLRGKNVYGECRWRKVKRIWSEHSLPARMSQALARQWGEDRDEDVRS